MKYILSRKARVDIIKIWEYTFEKWSLEQADKYYRFIFGAIKDLVDHHKKKKSYEMIRSGYRGLHIKSHILLFHVSGLLKHEVCIGDRFQVILLDVFFKIGSASD